MVDSVIEQLNKLGVFNVDFAPKPEIMVDHRNFRVEQMGFFAKDRVCELRLTSSV